jgi:hypothetical protein
MFTHLQQKKGDLAKNHPVRSGRGDFIYLLEYFFALRRGVAALYKHLQL